MRPSDLHAAEAEHMRARAAAMKPVAAAPFSLGAVDLYIPETAYQFNRQLRHI